MARSRKTRQMEDLEEILTKMEPFFTADNIFEKINDKKQNIGIATIYRFLKQKAELGELHSYRCDGKTIYSLEKLNHSHFICKQCGRTTHFIINDISSIHKAIKGKMCHFQLDAYGICESCLRRRKD